LLYKFINNSDGNWFETEGYYTVREKDRELTQPTITSPGNVFHKKN
jgi:hypothetical protein